MPQKRGRVLVAHHAYYQADRFGQPLVELGQRLGDGPRAVLVMGAVEPQLGALLEETRQGPVVEPLHASRPAHLGEATLDGGVGEAEGLELQGGCNRGAGVADLVMAHQRGRGEVHQPRLALVDEAAALLEGLEALAPDQERGGDRPGAGADHLLRLRRLAGDDGGDAALEDAGLLAGDGGKGVAELVLVIERDGRDDAERRARDDVGGVEPASETDLQDQRVGWMLGEGQEGGSGRDLEIGDVVAGVGAPGCASSTSMSSASPMGRALPSAPASSMRSWKRTRCGEV